MTPDPTNTLRQRAYRHGVELRLLTWTDDSITALLRPPVGDIEVRHGTWDEVRAWVESRIPARPRCSVTRAVREAAAARLAEEQEAAR